jgi:hypothetical protein
MVSVEVSVRVTVWVREPPTRVDVKELFAIVGPVVAAWAMDGSRAAMSSAKRS